ncbi:MAG: type III-B CRISPR module-associated Cmr3 family protein [Verrucomicrobiota bacterium]
MPSFHLIEPSDVLFFRDAIPMSAGMGKGAGCRLPFPSTLHEGLRASLLKQTGREVFKIEVQGSNQKQIATKAFSSMRTTGPFPWHKDHGVLFPVPMDGTFNQDRTTLQRLQLLVVDGWQASAQTSQFAPPCLPVAVSPPDKLGALHGWWTAEQYSAYLCGESKDLTPIPTEALWRPEHRIGVQIDASSFAAADGQLFAGTYLRLDPDARLYFEAELAAERSHEVAALEDLQWLLLGGERRISRLRKLKSDPVQRLRKTPMAPAGDGPVLLKWILLTPAIFAHGNIPGWCTFTDGKSDGLPIGQVRLGASKRKAGTQGLSGRAQLISWCLGKPQTVSGWDNLAHQAKPTQLAVPAGSVYYFLCENADVATALAAKLHWQPRSDHYGEKGCGVGLCSFDAHLHATSADIQTLQKFHF